MTRSLRGRLVTSAFAEDALESLSRATRFPDRFQRDLDRWAERRVSAAGPAWSARAVADRLIVPLLRILGYEVIRHQDNGRAIRLDASAGASTRLPVLVVGYDEDLASTWRDVVLAGVAVDARWCLCANGRAARVCDAHHTWSRDYLEFDFDLLAATDRDMQSLWTLLGASSMAAAPPLLDVAVAASARHGTEVRRTLADGVLRALDSLLQALRNDHCDRGLPPFEQAITVIFRILFLLFAEARGLVPVWHHIYRDRYTIESIVAAVLERKHVRGVWAALQAIARLAHSGCTAGDLRVTAFNGRLFAPAHAPAFERKPLDDSLVTDVLLAVSTAPTRSGRTRIRYRDLDVEQLGAVYERVLEYTPSQPGVRPARNRQARKASGTFYTPRAMTAHLVRQVLDPVVRDRSSDDILSIRVLDPAMGSGAFLVAACRYLARSAEEALVREGRWHSGDVTPDDRIQLRRRIAQRCLYGVDLNPVAVQLARLSLWLTTLAGDKPLTFLDHHLIAGNSLVGATFSDLARQPGGSGRAGGRPAALPLFEDFGLEGTLTGAGRTRMALAAQDDETAAIVREKERALASIHAPDGPLGRWTALLDLWCSGWFITERWDRALFSELADQLIGRRVSLPDHVLTGHLERARGAAAIHRFLHWPAAFPEVFSQPADGFDIVIGNPPWDMVRADAGDEPDHGATRAAATQLTRFVREAGVYRVPCHAHVNRYALFVERLLQLVRPGGRVGLILPAGIVTDVGTAPLRRHLFDRVDVESVTGLDNSQAIFPIHRSVKFVLISGTAGAPTESIACRFGLSDPDSLPTGPTAPSESILVSRSLLVRVSGTEDLGIPEITSQTDLRILEDITARVPSLGSRDGWNVQFGRELNATDDRASFHPFTGDATSRPVLEGKQLTPFRVDDGNARYEIRPGTAIRIGRRARLAYRDVASATNRLTLIAGIIPARCVTTHTLFCLKTNLPIDSQHVLCALLNSFVANYLIRMRVNTHVSATLMSRLRVPLIRAASSAYNRLARLSTVMSTNATPVESMDEYIELQARCARAYEVTVDDLRHIVSTFPLISESFREACVKRFREIAERRKERDHDDRA